jgi:transcriptional regulator with XRE-family HTH domain
MRIKSKMYDLYSTPDDALLHRIGERLKAFRLGQNLSQREVAERSGLSRSAISQAELGRAITLGSLLQILRTLQQLEALDAFFAPQPPSPILALKMAKKQRRRAYPTADDGTASIAKEPSAW